VVDIAQRKKELLHEIGKNPKALRGTLRVQAVFRGRITRIRVRREAQMHPSLAFLPFLTPSYFLDMI
jgi:hypothetical protein